MSQRNDCKFAWLGAEGYAGQINDRWSAWLTAQGFPAGQLNDQEFAWLGSLGFTGTLNDRWFAYLKQLVRDAGPILALPDMMQQFWCGGGGVGPGPIQYLLDARFDSYPGIANQSLPIADQSLTDGTELLKPQGVQVGSLFVETKDLKGQVARLEGGALVLPINSSFFPMGDGERVKSGPFPTGSGGRTARWAKWKFIATPSGRHSMDEHVSGFAKTKMARGTDGDVKMNGAITIIYSEAFGGIRWEPKAPGTLSVPIQDGDVVEIFILVSGDKNKRALGYTNVNRAGWLLNHEWPNWVEQFGSFGFMQTSSKHEEKLLDLQVGSLSQQADYEPIATGETATPDTPSTVGDLIDALPNGDLISADFGADPGSSGAAPGATLTLKPGDELHDDYPANGVGKIRKGALIYEDPNTTGNAITLAGGHAAMAATGNNGERLRGLDSYSGEAGLCLLAETQIFGTFNGVGLYQASPSNTQEYGMLVVNSEVEIQYRDAVGALKTIRPPVTSDPQGTMRSYQEVIGAYNSSGEPVPSGGTHGALFFYEDKLLFSTAERNNTFSLDARATAGAASGRYQVVDSLQLIDKKTSALKTPQRALFNEVGPTTIPNYTPEDGVPFTMVGSGGAKVESNRLEPTDLTSQIAYAVVKNPGGYYWEAEYYIDKVAGGGFGIVFRFQDDLNYWGAYALSNGTSRVLQIHEHTGGTRVLRAHIPASTLALGQTARMIVTDDGTNISMITPESGEVLTPSPSTAGNQYDGAGVAVFTDTTVLAYCDWFAARTGTVGAYK